MTYTLQVKWTKLCNFKQNLLGKHMDNLRETTFRDSEIDMKSGDSINQADTQLEPFFNYF